MGRISIDNVQIASPGTLPDVSTSSNGFSGVLRLDVKNGRAFSDARLAVKPIDCNKQLVI